MISRVATKKEKAPNNQVQILKPPGMQKILQMMQTVAQRSWITACQIFCLPLDSLNEGFTCCSRSLPQPHEEKSKRDIVGNSPSTIMIVNISNSTLIDCVIGDSSACAEHQRLMEGSEQQKPAPARCSCGYGEQGKAELSLPPPSSCVSIQSSHVTYAIIGNNNYLHAEQ